MEDISEDDRQRWVLDTLREFIHLGPPFEKTHEYLSTEAVAQTEIPPLEERLEYLRKFTAALERGREITSTYNCILLGLLAVYTIVHILEKRRDHKEWLKKRGFGRTKQTATAPDDVQSAGNHIDITYASSSTDSTSSGIVTPSGAGKDVEVDIERLPLLGPPPLQTGSGVSRLTRLNRRLVYWLQYQPRSLPVVNRDLPSNGTSLFIAGWFALNLFMQLYQVTWQPIFARCFADRSSCVFMVNLPLLYILAAKNQPLKILTGRSYEALNIFHRRVGEWLCLEGFVHSLLMFLWKFFFRPEWAGGNPSLRVYLTHPIVYTGLVMLVSYELLYVTSLKSFRQAWYELFLASHVVLQTVALFFLYLHYPTPRPYVFATLAIFLVDRIIWRLCLKSASLTMDIKILPDGETLLLSADWEIPTSAPGGRGGGGGEGNFPWWNPRRLVSLLLRSRRQNIIYGWRPTDHVFLTVPALGRTHALQTHPFTIASEAPPPPLPISTTSHDIDEQPQQSPPPPAEASLRLLIRAHEGFTADLLEYAHHHSTVSVRLDGPYGSSHALDMLRAADHPILVAGGSGIAVTFPLAWALLLGQDQGRGTTTPDSSDDVDDVSDDVKQNGLNSLCPVGGEERRRRNSSSQTSSISARRRRGQQTVRMLWVIRQGEHHSWVPQEKLDELVRAGLDLVIPPPTLDAGRPDVEGIVAGWLDDAQMSSGELYQGGGRDKKTTQMETSVVVSGPDELNRMVRNKCAEAMGKGANIRLAVEKFGW